VSLTSTARSRLFFFGALYFAQGVPWGFITVPLQTYMTGQGMGPKEIGSMISLAYMPWAFKPLLGPLTDAIDLGRLGRRRPWILGAEIGMGVTLLILAGLDLQGAMPRFLGLSSPPRRTSASTRSRWRCSARRSGARRTA
jgi:PAT family beta-lactamase induction signal transducer AmpG